MEIEIDVAVECTLEQASNFFEHEFFKYSLLDYKTNPLYNGNYDEIYTIENIEIKEV